jgi:hypothetical protein
MTATTPSNPWRLAARVSLLLLLATTLSGCAKFVYNRLDTMASWYLRDLVSLDEQQRTDLRDWLGSTLDWHRKTELGRYARYLRELAAGAAHPANRDSYVRVLGQFETFVDDLAAQVAPDATRLLLTLAPQQVDELIGNLEEKSQERSEKERATIADGTWHNKRMKEMQRSTKRWTGTVTDEQKLLIKQAALRLQPELDDWLASQGRWRASLRAALAERDSPQAARERILQLLRSPEREWTEPYREKSAHNRAEVLTLLTALDASLTRPQRDHLRSELTEVAEQLEALIDTT